jgi:DNA repair protein RecO (recombination protein O)
MLTKTAAICIHASDFSETSQILTFFTKIAGKIKVIAKGSKRPKSPFGGPVEILSHGKIVFSDSSREKLATLTEFDQQPGFTHLADNLFAMNCCLFAAELVDCFTDDYDPHPQLFDSFLQFLNNISDAGHESRATISLLILFQLTLLKEIGLAPILNHCANCKTRYGSRLSAVLSGVALAKTEASAKAEATRDEFYFSSSANGLVCRDCESSFPDKIKLTPAAANSLANLKLIAQANDKTLDEIESILIHYFTALLHRTPKMAKYVIRGF